MKFVSWNVNGLRAIVKKDFYKEFNLLDADFFCVQETKLQAGQIEMDLPGYDTYWSYADRKGYSGTAIFTRHKVLSVNTQLPGIEIEEGRVVVLELPDFFLVNVYTPNIQSGLARADFRQRWDDAFVAYVCDLDKRKPVIMCGDFNVAHNDIDLKNPAANRGQAGFSDQERGCFNRLLDSGFTDTFRHLHPDTEGAYSWWSYMNRSRQRNDGWRIDYFLVSNRLGDTIEGAQIEAHVMGSDHAPVTLILK